MPDSLVGVNTLVPNRLVKTSIKNDRVPELVGYPEVRSEVQTSKGSRLDLVLTDAHGARCFVEIKNCTLVNRGVACFPDAVTQRGLTRDIGVSCFFVFNEWMPNAFGLQIRLTLHTERPYGRSI